MITNSCSSNSNGNDLTALFKTGLSWAIEKLSSINKLKLFEFWDKTVRSSKFV